MFFDSILNFVSFFWFNFFNEIALIQASIILLTGLLYNTNNVYYVLVYSVLYLFFLGIFMCYYQLDLFAGFLWTTELTAYFIFLLLLFYVLPSGNVFNKSLFKKTTFFTFVFLFLFILLQITSAESDVFIPLNYVDCWDDYYESFDNTLMTDFYGLFISYYYYNIFFTILIGFLLLVVSLICVLLNKVTKIAKKAELSTFLTFFSFFQDFLTFSFLRKQNLYKQNYRPAGTQIFKKAQTKSA